uniref:Uncharacterized protein n=1 Tax=Anthurium amnicola TaxID=1678845 RepID=A0A1D1XFH9_9ARAE
MNYGIQQVDDSHYLDGAFLGFERFEVGTRKVTFLDCLATVIFSSVVRHASSLSIWVTILVHLPGWNLQDCLYRVGYQLDVNSWDQLGLLLLCAGNMSFLGQFFPLGRIAVFIFSSLLEHHDCLLVRSGNSHF